MDSPSQAYQADDEDVSDLRRRKRNGSTSKPGDNASSAIDPASNRVASAESISDQSKNQSLFARIRDSAPFGFVQRLVRLPKVYGMTPLERDNIRGRNSAFVAPGDYGAGDSFANKLTIAVVGTFGKLLLSGLNTLSAYRMDVLYSAIESRDPGRGLLTVSNHQSVIDDPLLLSALLPPRILYRPSVMRWGLCSVDICFQARFYAAVCRLGKTLPMMRLGGLRQPHLAGAASRLRDGGWVHLFPEGRVRQRGMGYAKRGLGKMIAMAYAANGDVPIVLPLYHEGVEGVMPQDHKTNKLKSIVPRVGQRVFAIAGDPVEVRGIVTRMMPDCEKAGGVANDPPECLRMYEEVADFVGLSLRLLRTELRQRARADHNVNLGDPYEVS